MPNKHLQRSRCFAFVLYPDEDKLHKFIFDYYTSRESCVWITHDRDFWTETDLQLNNCTADEVGTLKKKHMHFLVRLKNPRSVVQFQNDCTFDVPISELESNSVVESQQKDLQEEKEDLPKSNKRTIHFEVVTSYESMIRYFLHDTVQAIFSKKVPYDVTELQGDKFLIYNAVSYKYPFFDDVFAQFVDLILTDHLQYHEFVQYVVGRFPTGSIESQVFYKYLYHFRGICESVRWDDYHKFSLSKKKKTIEDIKSELESD